MTVYQFILPVCYHRFSVGVGDVVLWWGGVGWSVVVVGGTSPPHTQETAWRDPCAPSRDTTHTYTHTHVGASLGVAWAWVDGSGEVYRLHVFPGVSGEPPDEEYTAAAAAAAERCVMVDNFLFIILSNFYHNHVFFFLCFLSYYHFTISLSFHYIILLITSSHSLFTLSSSKCYSCLTILHNHHNFFFNFTNTYFSLSSLLYNTFLSNKILYTTKTCIFFLSITALHYHPYFVALQAEPVQYSNYSEWRDLHNEIG